MTTLSDCTLDDVGRRVRLTDHLATREGELARVRLTSGTGSTRVHAKHHPNGFVNVTAEPIVRHIWALRMPTGDPFPASVLLYEHGTCYVAVEFLD